MGRYAVEGDTVEREGDARLRGKRALSYGS